MNEKRARFLTVVDFQPIKFFIGSLDDRELVKAAQSIWDAQIKAGMVIPVEITFPIVTMNGVELDWDEDQTKIVFRKGSVIVRDNLTDNYRPNPVDLENDDVLVLHDDQYVVYEGGPHDDQLVLIDYVA